MSEKVSYAELLRKARGDEVSPEQMELWHRATASVCKELGSDLTQLVLTDDSLVRDIIVAKLEESGCFGEEAVRVTEGSPARDDKRLGGVVLGSYSEGGYNLEFVIDQGRVIALYMKIPQGGNLMK